ncbi:hypothetical protein PybrP1_001076 [[Pythium] brassicae (nom. inval.)]|nr:hypothetical protein PybrP1_001076 [[Pythium] brassicae (nom. inval.)]
MPWLSLLASKTTELLERFHEWKSEPQHLGRYSIEKLATFDAYQNSVSRTRVALVVLLSPLPTVFILCALDAIPLKDPRLDVSEHWLTFVRSAISHTLLAYALLIAVKQAIGLDNNAYSHKTIAFTAICTGVAQEALWTTVAFTWRFPVPFREFIGVVPLMTFTVAFTYVFARDTFARRLQTLIKYTPIVSLQLVLFYFFLVLSLGFAYVPTLVQVAMMLLFPFFKVATKRFLWRYAQKLDDVSTDVTICLVELSGSLYQTVCMQFVNSSALTSVIMLTDFIQAALEVRAYLKDEYMTDGRSTLQTAIKIVECATNPVAEDENSGGRAPSRGLAARQSSYLNRRLASSNSLNKGLGAGEDSEQTSLQALWTASKRGASAGSIRKRANTVVFIDGMRIQRKDQARVLEQTLQLLFACEVLIFAEYMEVFMPVLYGSCIGSLWTLPTAKYNQILMRMTHAQMKTEVLTSFAYAAAEALSFLSMHLLIKRKYGISTLYLLAFVLETYWLTLQGKLIGCFITIMNSAMVHQGVDFSFRFDYNAMLSGST